MNEDIKVIAAGKIISGFEILKLLALGAHSVCADVTFSDLTAYGNRHEKNAPYPTNDLHYRHMKDMSQMMNADNFRSLKEITLSTFLRRLDVLHTKGYVLTEKQIVYIGTIKKMYDDETNKTNASCFNIANT